jgi:hypothetical protein
MDGAAVSPGPENPGDFETNRKKEKKRRAADRESESRNVVKLERLEVEVNVYECVYLKAKGVHYVTCGAANRLSHTADPDEMPSRWF